MAYWIAEKDDTSPYDGTDIMVYPSLVKANQYSIDLQNLCLSYATAPEGVSNPTLQDKESMHMWYNNACQFVTTWKNCGINKDLQNTIRRVEKWLLKNKRNLPNPIDFGSSAKSPPIAMVQALNRVVRTKTSQTSSVEFVYDFYTNLDPFEATCSTEQEWFDFFSNKWTAST